MVQASALLSKHLVWYVTTLLQVLGAHIDSWVAVLAAYASAARRGGASPAAAAAGQASACAERLRGARRRFLELRTCFDAGGRRRAALDGLVM